MSKILTAKDPHSQGKRAIVLYAVADRDFMDFLDMLNEEEDSEVVKLLHEMVTTPNPKSDEELNDTMAPIVKKRLDALKSSVPGEQKARR